MFATSIMSRHSVRKFAAALCTGALLALATGGSAMAQGGRPDQVFLVGSTRQETGVITENSLSNVLLSKDGKERRLEASRVERIIWGAVSAPYREGMAYFDRGDFENAAAKFGLAATEDERDVIKADARKLGGMALLKLGVNDASQFNLALDQFNQFLKDYPNSRLVPEVRALQARATLLRGDEGDVAAAGALYRSLFEAGSGATPTEGYSALGSYEAGLQGIRALTQAGETLGAREISGVLASGISTLLATAEEGSILKIKLTALSAEVQLAEGFVLLAANQARQAETFFKSQLQSSEGGPAGLRYGSMLGLGQAYLAQDKFREASVEFATVASIDYTDRDRSARALLLLAETMTKLGDSDGVSQARKRLNVIIKTFGDTPSAAAAKKALAAL
ncbi:MAG: TolA-binding protein [Planctomycetota bacterium]|jgi:TolA-binding protein